MAQTKSSFIQLRLRSLNDRFQLILFKSWDRLDGRNHSGPKASSVDPSVSLSRSDASGTQPL